MNESLTYLERWALTSRRRQGGEVVTEAARGMIVAGFRHRTSRAGDPQLHTHALMASAVQRHDGSWGAVDSRVVYRQARSAGFVYQAVLRSQLTEGLGVDWEPVDDRGIAELVDVPVAARLLFSKRRHQIEEALEAADCPRRERRRCAHVPPRAKRHADALPDRDDVIHLFGEPLPAFAAALAWLAELKTGGDQSLLADLRAIDQPRCMRTSTR